MKTKICPVPLSQALRRVFLILSLVGLFGPAGRSQEIRIKVLKGRNGKPITKECLNIWVGTLAGPHLVGATNRNGVVVLRVLDDKLVAEAGCRGWPAEATLPTVSQSILVAGDYYVACQEYSRVVPNAAKPKFIGKIPPLYPIAEILGSGVTASNTCGKFRAKSKPGELIFFVKPRGFMERLRE